VVPAASPAVALGTTDIALLSGMAAAVGGTTAHVSTVGGGHQRVHQLLVWEQQRVSQQRGQLLVRERNIMCLMKKLYSQHAVELKLGLFLINM